MTEYEFRKNYIIDKMNVKYNEDQLGVNTTSATVEYHYIGSDGKYKFDTDEIGNEDVEIAIKRFVHQSGKTRDELKKEGKLYVRDFKEERDKERKLQNKKRIKIALIATGTIIMVSSIGYALSSNRFVRAEKVTKDVNQSVLYNSNNTIAYYVTHKAQMLYQNSIDSKRKTYKKQEAYKYCMYVANLIMGGDDLGCSFEQSEAIMGSVRHMMETNHILTWDNNPNIVKMSNGYNISKNRLLYGATRQESDVFKALPIESRIALVEQFLEVAKAIRFEYEPSLGNIKRSDYPSWWVNGKKEKSYNYDKLMDEVSNYQTYLVESEKSSSK